MPGDLCRAISGRGVTQSGESVKISESVEWVSSLQAEQSDGGTRVLGRAAHSHDCSRLGDLTMIPGAGDLVYIPDAEESGVYRHLKITARHFYYSQEGAVVSIRLHCDVL